MLLGLTRRICATLLSFALLLGPAAYSVHASGMNAKMITAMSSDMHSSGACDDCDGNKAGAPASACSVISCSGMSCSGMIAVLPGAAQFARLAVEAHGHAFASVMRGLDAPPDPYPPKATVLS
jgi:hypothetical protein